MSGILVMSYFSKNRSFMRFDKFSFVKQMSFNIKKCLEIDVISCVTLFCDLVCLNQAPNSAKKACC